MNSLSAIMASLLTDKHDRLHRLGYSGRTEAREAQFGKCDPGITFKKRANTTKLRQRYHDRIVNVQGTFVMTMMAVYY